MMTTRIFATVTLTFLLFLGAGAQALEREPVTNETASAGATLRWGYYITWDETSYDSLVANVDQLDIVSPYFYHLTPSGTLKSFAQPLTTEFLQNRGVKVVPLIQNESEWDDFRKTIETPQKRDAIVQLIYDMVESNGYDGVHIDFEAINASDADLLTDFMTRLYAKLHPAGYHVSQAVIAKTSDASSYWGGAYDYEALAAVNDLIVIMAYDYGYSGRPDPIAVAPIWWVEDVVRYATRNIPREKVMLGVPFYGYDWNTTKGPPASSVSFAGAQELAERDGATNGYSTDDGAPWVRYKDDAGDDHEVWYESSRSFETKLRLVIDNRLAGFAAWRLGHEDPAIWDVVAGLNTPATRIAPFPNTSERIYFPETGHSLAYGFLKYWRENGGLERFGYPRTEEFTEFDPMVGESYTVQYFERARFEFHPEYAGTQFEVLLGHTGRWALEQRGIDHEGPPAAPKPGARYFSETGHNLSGAFLRYWENNGGLYTHGYPVTEEFTEINPEDGKSYTVQYFERARFEYHPEYAGTKYEVLLGLLGNEMLRERRWIP
jgi:spore germination protein YaaH